MAAHSTKPEGAGGRARRALLRVLLGVALLGAWLTSAHALEPIVVQSGDDKIDITSQSEYFVGRGDRLQVETAASGSGITGRMEVKAAEAGTNPNWILFALSNATNRQVERLLVADRYALSGSGLLLPDLDARRVTAVTPSLGFVPERVDNDLSDIFKITLEPGETVTYVVELDSERIPRITLWKPATYDKRVRDRTLLNGVLIGFTVIVAVFLIAAVAVSGSLAFPSAGLVAVAVLAYLCIDFGLWHKLLQLPPEENGLYRAVAESAIAASLVLFLYTFLRIGLWHRWARSLFWLWLLAQVAVVGLAFLDPRLAATLARASLLLFAGTGTLLVGYFVLRGLDRALFLMPAWLLFLVWLFAAAVVITGRITSEPFSLAIVAGLAVLVLMLALTVGQYAFRTADVAFAGPQSDLETRSLAVDAAGMSMWEWSSRRDEITASPAVEDTLGLRPGELTGRVADWLKHVHPADRDRLRLSLLSVQEKNGGSLQMEFRLRGSDSTYRWFDLRAATLPMVDQRSMKCVGLMRDVTAQKRAYERLVHDAVHDSLTGLPNRELLLDRLSVAIVRAKHQAGPRPTLVYIDIDRFKNVNNAFGLIVGDSMLLTIARRLGRHVGAQDTLARIGGDRFAILLAEDKSPQDVAMLAERVRRAVRSPMRIAGKEIILTGSIGIAVFDGEQASAEVLLSEAEAAMFRAKRAGSDRIEIFKASMRGEPDERVAVESELRRAIEKNQFRILYQPILRLGNDELAGFEALIRWEHPRLGQLAPKEFLPLAEEADLVPKLGSHVLTRSAREVARWQKELPRSDDPLFVSVNLSSRDLFRQDLIQEIRALLGRDQVPRGCVCLELTESLVMENPEQAAEVLDWLKSAGASLSLDDFGTGYSSLAYLNRFAFDTIKIDRSLVRDAVASPAGAAIVKSIVALAHELGRKVVAEGVETPEDASYLRSIGCDLGQGFYFGEPMTEKEVSELLGELRRYEKRGEKRGLLGGAIRQILGGSSGGDDGGGEPSALPPKPRGPNGDGGSAAAPGAGPRERPPGPPPAREPRTGAPPSARVPPGATAAMAAATGPIGAAREAHERRDPGAATNQPPHGTQRMTARAAPGEAEVVALPRRPRGES